MPMKVTVEEIAKMAGVSKATVSRVLNRSVKGVSDQTRQRIQKILDEVNYSHDSVGTAMRSRVVALVVPDITNPFFADIARSVTRRAMLDNYAVILVDTAFSAEKEQELVANLVAKKIDGMILVSSCTTGCKEHRMLEKYGIPLVLLDRKLEGVDFGAGIYSDNEYAAFCCCEKLIKSGAREIAFISGPLKYSTAKERMSGYQAALKQYAIPLDPSRIKTGDYTVNSGYSAIMEMEKENIRYSAVLAANDLMALGALRALKEFSYRIPEDKQIIGFDNIDFTQYCEPSLSTVQQPSIEMGKCAMEALLKLLNGETEKASLRLQPKLLLRQSTKP